MKEFKDIIKKKGIKKVVVYCLLTLIALSPFFILNKSIIASFKGTCIATNMKELKSCQKSGRYTKIKTENVYNVEYNYVVDGKVKGKFLDIDLEGNVILSLVDTATADQLLNQKGIKEIEGNLIPYRSKVFKDTLDKVQADYIERFSNSSGVITEDQTRGMFYSYLLDQYDGKGFAYIIPVILIGIMIILLLFKIIEGIKMIIKPEKFIVYGRKMLENVEQVDKASFEYQNGPYLFQNKDIRITNNYIFDTKGYDFIFHKVNDAVWMYEKGMKRYGLIETGKNLVIRFKDKVGFVLSLTLTERKKVMEILRVKNPNIIKGYDQETEEKYRKNPEQLK